MQIPFDVFSTCDADLLLQALVSGRSIESKNTPIRLALNISSDIICVVALPNADVCLGPFQATEKGLEEAVYDGIHCLETKGLIESFEIRASNSPNVISKHESLDVVLRGWRAMTRLVEGKNSMIVPKMKPEGEVEQ